MRQILFALALLSVSCTALAQSPASPVGRWQTLDDETGKVMTIAEVYQARNGTLAAKIVEAVDPSAATCTKCGGARKGKPTVGMPILWNLSPAEGGWGGGEGYKPSQDMNFKAKSVKLADGGNKLEVVGCKLMICRTATWVRVR